ncbi:glycine cleavage system protein T, partial [Microbacterium maritypicum]
MSDPRYTPLRERHEALGASFTDFGGWQMPVRYTSDLAEHHAVRESAGIFDISHMAEFLVTGEAAAEFLDYALAGRISAMPVGKAKYSLLLAEGGGIIDDVIAYRLAEDRYLVIANAGNRGFVDSAFAKRVRDFPSLVERDLPARAPGEERSFAGFLGDRGVDVEDVSDDYALIAVQGPNAEAILAATADITDVSIPWSEQKYYAWASANYRGKPLLLARTGYTGEDGFELLVAADDAAALWDALLAAGT